MGISKIAAARIENPNSMPAASVRTRVTDGVSDYTVVTNMTAVEKNDKLAVAYLPPREIFGTVSEAMFLGSEKRPEDPGTLLSDDQVDTREAASILYKQNR